MPAILVNDVSPVISYVATASQTLFTVPFEFFNVADIVVQREGATLTYSATPANNNQYSVIGANAEGGGSITLGGAGATLSDNIVIYRDVKIERLANYPETGPMAVRSLNAEQAKHIAMLQQLERDISRGLSVPIGESAINLPSAADRADTILTFDENGNVDTSYTTEILDRFNLIPVSDGGTGVSSLTSGYLLKGNGTSPVTASILNDTGTNIGINKASPTVKLDVFGNTSNIPTIVRIAHNSSGSSFDYAGYALDAIGASSGLVTWSTGAIRAAQTWLSTTGATPLVFGTNDAERMRIDGAGLVGIGASSLTYALTIGSASGGTTAPTAIQMDASFASADQWDRLKFYILKDGSQSYGLGLGSAADLQYWAGGSADGAHRFFTARSERMRINAAGDMGIGTTLPVSTTISAGSITTAGVVAVKGYLSSNQTSVGIIEHVSDKMSLRPYGPSAGSGYLTFTSGGGGGSADIERMRIDLNGKVLVGASSSFTTGGNAQYSRLQMVGNAFAGTGHAIFALGRGKAATSITAGEILGFIGFGDNAGGTFASISGEADAAAGTNDYPGRLLFSTTADGVTDPTERMRITSSGNVGIGATSPGGKTEIVSSGAQTSLLLRNSSSSMSSYSEILLAPFTGTTAASSAIRNTYTQNNNSTLQFYTTNSASAPIERMQIDPSGNVGIGTTAITSKLTVGGSSGSVATPTAVEMDGTYATTSAFNTLKYYLFKGASESYGFGLGALADVSYWAGSSSTGMHRFFTSQTERLRIESTGNVGIGTTAPSSSAILDVQSTTKGFRLPNMTTTQKNAISSPVAGLMVFDTTLAKACVYSGSAWQTITSI